MNKTYLKSAVASGIIASSIAVFGQGAGGAGGGGGAGAGGAGGAAGGGAAVGGVAPGASVRGVGTARSGAVNAPAGGVQSGTARSGLNTAGAASITQPATTPPIGGASVIETAPNAVGGSASGNTILSSPGGGGRLGANAALPGAGATLNQQAIPVTTLPGPVQTTLQGFTSNGQLGSVSQIQGLNGPIYRATVTQNGAPVELQISQTGQILSRTAAGTSVGPITTANSAATTLANAQAGLPVSALPPAVQTTLQTQLGANGQVQTVSRDDLANGSVFRVTTTQNGVPTEMRFAANGTLLSSTPITGAATSAFNPNTAGGTIVPGGGGVVVSDLPAGVQTAIRSQLGGGRLSQITQQPGANGAFLVRYDLNGRPMMMTIGADGRVISNAPLSAVGNAAPGAIGTGTATDTPARGTNSTTKTSMNLEDLPDAVEQTLRREARYAEVRSVTREQRVGGDVYTIAIRDDNTVGDLTINADGQVLSDNRRNFAEFSTPRVAVDDEKVTGMPYNTVPRAIQDAIKAYATASDIRSITLGNDRDGKAVYDVIFYRDGRRDRMIVLKDGTLRRIEQNVSPALEIPDPNKQPMLAIGDLPQQARDTVRRHTDSVLIKEIGTKQVGDDTVYQVRYETNGAPVELLVASDGRVVLPEGSLDREAAGAPLQAPINKEELASAKVVNATEPARSSTGAAASVERGSVNSALDNSSREPARTVELSEVPVPVQNTAKKLAGSATIDTITPKLTDSGLTYEVGFQQNGVRKTIQVNKDGAVVNE